MITKKGKKMKTIDRTISFRQDMIDLILSGKKTVTIRPIKPQPELINEMENNGLSGRMYMQWQGKDLSEKGREWFMKQYPHGEVGDIMTIRERPDIRLKITHIYAMKLRDIQRELWIKDNEKFRHFHLWQDEAFYDWQSFYGNTEYKWYKNPWVWIVEFGRVMAKGEWVE